MMNKLKAAVTELVEKELSLASEQHGEKFQSHHEAYAVILEEVEETLVEVEFVKHWIKVLWTAIKDDNFTNTETSFKLIEEKAILAACEAIQVAAMAEKAIRGDKDGRKKV